jgi:hypothetical protein
VLLQREGFTWAIVVAGESERRTKNKPMKIARADKVIVDPFMF